MAVIRRTRVKVSSSPGDTRVGILLMRRVERKDSPKEPHWCVWTTTDHDAIHKIASGMREKPELFHVVKRGQ